MIGIVRIVRSLWRSLRNRILFGSLFDHFMIDDGVVYDGYDWDWGFYGFFYMGFYNFYTYVGQDASTCRLKSGQREIL